MSRAERDRNDIADRVAEGMSISKAGGELGLTPARTKNIWRSIKRKLGEQAQ